MAQLYVAIYHCIERISILFLTVYVTFDIKLAERDAMAAIGSPPTQDNNVKAGRSGETSNRGRKK